MKSRATWQPARKAVNRRDAAALLGVTTCWPMSGRTQPARNKARLGYLGGIVPDPGALQTMFEPLRQGLRELGYIEGQNLTIDTRWAEGKPERLPALLAELIALAPDVLIAAGPRPAMVARDATQTVPVVAVAVDDPVVMGLAVTHARPGRNITGVAVFEGLFDKRLQVLKDMVPSARRFAVLLNPFTASREQFAKSVPRIESNLRATLTLHEASAPDHFEAAFAAMVRQGIDAVSILADATFWTHRAQLGALCVKHKLPSAWGGSGYLDAGGLVSFQADFAAMFRRSASLVDKILKGAKPGDLAFEQATDFEFVVSLKAARALGLTVPQSVLVSASRVIS